MNRIMYPIIFALLLFGLFGFVAAKMTVNSSDGYNYDTEVHVTNGWNLILMPDSDMRETNFISDSQIKKENIKAIFLYLPNMNDYIEIYPNNKLKDKFSSSALNNYESLLGLSSAWVYFDKSGVFKYKRVDVPKISQVTLAIGWNFLTIKPEISGKTLNEIQGDCNIEKAYGWGIKEQGWYPLPQDIRLTDTETPTGTGIIVKVSNKCILNSSTSSNSISPPAIPSSSEDCSGGKLFDPYKRLCVDKNVLCELDKDCTLLEMQTAYFSSESLKFTLLSASEGIASNSEDDTAIINIMNGPTTSLESSYGKSIAIFGSYKIVFESADGDYGKIMGASFEVTKS